MNPTRKFIFQLKAGDVVRAHGGKFRVLEDARDSRGHRPMADHLVVAHGPSACAVAPAVCIEGQVGGYFYPGSDWTFQGNLLAGTYAVE